MPAPRKTGGPGGTQDREKPKTQKTRKSPNEDGILEKQKPRNKRLHVYLRVYRVCIVFRVGGWGQSVLSRSRRKTQGPAQTSAVGRVSRSNPPSRKQENQNKNMHPNEEGSLEDPNTKQKQSEEYRRVGRGEARPVRLCAIYRVIIRIFRQLG